MSAILRMALCASVGLSLAGCGEATQYPEYSIDQKVRAERFDACMRLIPAGPQSTTYNDWAEVIEECADIAAYQAKKCVRYCEGSGLHNPIEGAKP